MIAWLGMYDMPALSDANDRLWQGIRAQLGTGPRALTRTDDPWPIWQSPDLLLAQTCGYPYRARLHGHVQLLATPDYGLPGCPPGHYCSVLVARAGDTDLAQTASGRFAYNEALSQSGWAAPIAHLLARDLRPASLLETGGHAASATAVAEGRADLAGIDALTWELLCAHAPDVTRALTVLARTAPTPTLPFITALGRDAPAIRAALIHAIDALEPAARATLHLHGLVDIPAAQYLAIQSPPKPQNLLP